MDEWNALPWWQQWVYMDELNDHLRHESGEEDADIESHGNAVDDILGVGILNEDHEE